MAEPFLCCIIVTTVIFHRSNIELANLSPCGRHQRNKRQRSGGFQNTTQTIIVQSLRIIGFLRSVLYLEYRPLPEGGAGPRTTPLKWNKTRCCWTTQGVFSLPQSMYWDDTIDLTCTRWMHGMPSALIYTPSNPSPNWPIFFFDGREFHNPRLTWPEGTSQHQGETMNARPVQK